MSTSTIPRLKCPSCGELMDRTEYRTFPGALGLNVGELAPDWLTATPPDGQRFWCPGCNARIDVPTPLVTPAEPDPEDMTMTITITADTEGWPRGDWMQTYTGRRFYPMAPRAEDIHELDIAHALSMQCRYNGHVDRFYSVAEHCVLMSEWMTDVDDALWALLHDAPEAYVGDMIRPLKNHMPEFVAVDDLVTLAVAERFDLAGWAARAQNPNKSATLEMPDAVRDADNRILLTERSALMMPAPGSWQHDTLPALEVTIHGWSPAEAERKYLDRLHELLEQRAAARRTTTLTGFVDIVREEVAAEIAHQKATIEAAGERLEWSLVHRWSERGSAGRAVDWIQELADDNPTLTPHELVGRLRERIGIERTAAPQFFTISHLRGVANLAQQIVDRLSTPKDNT